MSKAPAFPLYAADFYMDTLTWDTDDIGVYFCLLMAEWVNGPLEADTRKLAKIAKKTNKKFNKNWKNIEQKFVKTGAGFLINLRLEAEREKQDKYREIQSYKGKVSAAKRSTGVPTTVQPVFQPEGNLSFSSSYSFKKKNNKKKSSPSQKIEFIDNHFQNIPEDLFAKWKEVAPGIDIEGEIKKAELWLISHPDRKRSRYSVYLSNWMNKAQENFIRYGGLRSGGTGRNVNADRAAAARESVYEQSGEKDSLPAESRARIEALRKASRDAGRDDAPDFQDG